MLNITRTIAIATNQWNTLSKKDFPEEVLWEEHACNHQQAEPVARVRWIPQQSWSVGAQLERLRLPWEEWEDYVYDVATRYAVARVRTWEGCAGAEVLYILSDGTTIRYTSYDGRVEILNRQYALAVKYLL